MQEIKTREEVSTLVHAFYRKIRTDDILGPIFNNRIPNDKWPDHLVKLTDFWETNLFGVARFKGNPTQKHVELDRDMNHAIGTLHFDRWLALWRKTVDELFVGERAAKAKATAERIGSVQLRVIERYRVEE
ncbi:group III truncated hemoglobin [Neolewinella antarctica]|uniref:Hemoglobin n=1 Tax=Neolewinella antarctica TaxID=442734 RepID=A0ABX0XDJ4_9BACT|nr:group III truncated hemoglobin [Neolewinella antarctica]NJC26983.1 hemoglobin [Neolewinella antarctica]